MKLFRVGECVSHRWCFSTVYEATKDAPPKMTEATIRYERGCIISILNGVALVKKDDGGNFTAPLCNLRRLVKKKRREFYISTNTICCRCEDGYHEKCGVKGLRGCMKVSGFQP